MLGARAGQQGTKPDMLLPRDMYGKGWISLVVQPAAPEVMLGFLEDTGAVHGCRDVSHLLSAGP